MDVIIHTIYFIKTSLKANSTEQEPQDIVCTLFIPGGAILKRSVEDYIIYSRDNLSK